MEGINDSRSDDDSSEQILRGVNYPLKSLQCDCNSLKDASLVIGLLPAVRWAVSVYPCTSVSRGGSSHSGWVSVL